MSPWPRGRVVRQLLRLGQRPMVEFSSTGLTIPSIVLCAMVNGAFEEVFLLGLLVQALRGFSLSLAVGLPLLVRLSYHLSNVATHPAHRRSP